MGGGRWPTRRRRSTLDPANVAAAVGWLASDLVRRRQRPGRQDPGRRRARSCRAGDRSPQVTSDKPWTIESIAAQRDALFANVGPRHPAVPAPDAEAEAGSRAARVGGRGGRVPRRARRVPRRARAARGARGLRLRRLRRRGATASSSPTGRATWQATLFDHGWMIPGVPARARRPERHAGADARVPRGDGAPAHPALAALPRVRDRRAEPPRVRERRAARRSCPPRSAATPIWCIGMSEPNAGSDLAGLQTRAGARRRPLRRSTARRCGRATRWSAQKCFCYVRTDPDAPKHKGISLLIVDMDTPGIDVRPLRHITRRRELRRGVLHRRRGPAREPRRRAQRRLAHHAGIARPRARRALGRGRVAGSRRRSHGAHRPRATRAGSTDDPVVRRRLAELYEQRAPACAPSATRGSRASPRGRRRPSTRT